jgi:hypothetical protein
MDGLFVQGNATGGLIFFFAFWPLLVAPCKRLC